MKINQSIVTDQELFAPLWNLHKFDFFRRTTVFYMCSYFRIHMTKTSKIEMIKHKNITVMN